MSQAPDKYQRQTNFTTDAVFTPIPSPSKLDSEFNAIKSSTDQVNNRLAEIQREDGALRNGIVTPDSVAASTGQQLIALIGDAENAANQAIATKNETIVVKNETAVIRDETQAIKDSAVLGIVPDESIATEKLIDGAVTEDKLSTGAVTTDKLGAEAVTTEKLDDEAVTLSKLAALVANALVPAGTVIHVAMNAAPNGYLKANGDAVSRTTYAALFAALGTTFGVGDGSTTFNLPDLRGEFIRGWADDRAVDTGRAFGSFQSHAFQTHTHDVDVATVAGSAGNYLNRFAGAQDGASSFTRSSWGNQTVAGANTSTETRPRNVALLACIKI